ETFGAPILDQEANRELFEEQVEIIFKAFNNESFSHNGKHYTLPPNVPYRGYELKELTLVPRPIHRPVECWQPIVSASARGLDFMVRHGIKGIIGGGAATMAEGPFHGYREAAARAGKHLELGENLCLGIFIHLAETREKAVREIKPFYEEHVKMFGPLGFVPGITPAQLEALPVRESTGHTGLTRTDVIKRTTGPETTNGSRWEVQLSATPPPEWLEFFKQSGAASASSATSPRPQRVTFDRACVVFKCDEDHVE